jgi:hypothetical protein
MDKSGCPFRQHLESKRRSIHIDADAGKIIDINHYLIDLLGYSKEYFLNSKFGIWNFSGVFLIKKIFRIATKGSLFT